MAIDISSLTAEEFLMLLNYEGNPPSDPEYDKIRMSHDEWATLYLRGPRKEVPHADADRDSEGG